jgi:uncharacterized protein involved in outer membrane biogenesis
VSKFLATVATLIIIVLIAALAAPRLINWNDYRELFETQASRLIGREVRVNGDVRLELLPTPQFSFEKVQIAGAGGAFVKPFVEMREFEMALSLGQLLSGAVEARRVQLVDPVFRLSVDAAGKSNWAELGPKSWSAAFPLAPREVAFKDVEISGGTVELRVPHNPAPVRLEDVTGRLGARALNGPFKFSGKATVRGHRLGVRLSTSRYQNGGLRLRAGVRDLDGGEKYQLDGDLRGLDGPLTFKGPLTIRASLGGQGREAARQDQETEETLEIKGQSLLTLNGARMDDLSLTVVKQDRPQALTGAARADWGRRSRLELRLGAKLLDLEPLLPHGAASAGSAEALAALAPRLLDSLPYSPREGALKLDVEQLLMGEDAIENLSLELAKEGRDADGKWRIATARAALPGASQLTVSGAFQDPGGGYQFAGAVDARGADLIKLLRWLAPKYDWAGDREPQRFALRGKVAAGPGGAAIEDASGELAGAAFTGSGRYERGERGAKGRLAVAAKADRLDLRPLFDENEGLTSLFGGTEGAAGTDKDKPGARSKRLLDAVAAGVAANDSKIDIHAGVLFLPGFEARNVAAKFRIREGAVDISKLSVTGEGLSIHADGRLEGYHETPEGAMRLTIQADTAASLKALALLLGAPEAIAGNGSRMEALAPARLEGAFTAARGAGLAELKLTGTAGGSAVSASGKLKGDRSRLWEGEIDFSASVNNPNGADLLRQIMPKGNQRGGARRNGPGALSVRARGSLKGLVEVNAELRAPEADARFVGKAAPSTKPWTMDGRVSAKARDAAGALAMLDLAPSDAPLHGGLELRAAMTKSGGHYEFTNAVLRLDGGRAEGAGSLDLDGETPAISATVASDEASLPRLLGLFVETSGPSAPGPASSDAVWPNRPFAFRTFDAMSGSLSLKARRLSLGGGVSLERSRLEAGLDKGALRLKKLTGRLWGGRFKASGALGAKTSGSPADAGAVSVAGRRISLSADIALDHADLKRLPQASGRRALARGHGDLRLSLSGEGLSPRGLAAVLSGEGSLRLEGGAIYGLAPQAVDRAARTFLAAPKRSSGGVSRFLKEEFRKSVFPYRPASAPVTVSNGVLQIPPTLLRSTKGAARVSATLDLSSLKADSEWELRAPSRKPVRKGGRWPDYMRMAEPDSWPPLKLVLAGPLSQFGSLPMQIEADEFQRSLTIRRMRRDVERLEELTPPKAPARQRRPGRADSGQEGGQEGGQESEGTATGTLPQPEPAAAVPGGQRPASEAKPEAPADPGPGPAPTAAAPTGPATTQPSVNSWSARTESPPAAGGGAGGNASTPEGNASAPAGFENRMRSAIGTPEPSSRTSPQDGAPSPASSEAARQEAQAQKRVKKPPQPAHKQSEGLFDWLR